MEKQRKESRGKMGGNVGNLLLQISLEKELTVFFFNLLERRKFLFYWGEGWVEAGSEVLLMER